MKATFYWQYRSELGHANWPDRRTENQVIWWPDQCEKIEVEVPRPLPTDGPDHDLEHAAEEICIREYRKTKNSSTHRMHDDDDIQIVVSRSPDVPGKVFDVTLYLEPSASAKPKGTKNPIRLPTPAEVAETESV